MSKNNYLIKKRYNYSRKLLNHIICSYLDDCEYCGLSLVDLLLPKVMGYGCKFEYYLKFVENNNVNLLSSALINLKFLKFQKSLTELEIKPTLKKKTFKKINFKFNKILIASNYKYAKFLINNIKIKNFYIITDEKTKDLLMKNKIANKNNILSFVDLNLVGKKDIRSKVEFKKLHDNLPSELKYYNNLKIPKTIIKNIFNYIEIQLPNILYFIDNFLKTISSTNLNEIFVARARRYTEITCLACCFSKNIKTTMLLNGLISDDFINNHFFTNDYKYVNKIYIYGKQAKDVIIKRCKISGDPIPKFRHLNNQSIDKIFPDQLKNLNILFVAQRQNEFELFKLSVKIKFYLNFIKKYKSKIFFKAYPSHSFFSKINLNIFNYYFLGNYILDFNNIDKLDFNVITSHSSSTIVTCLKNGKIFLPYKSNLMDNTFLNSPFIIHSKSKLFGDYQIDNFKKNVVEIYNDKFFFKKIIDYNIFLKKYFTIL